jgi:predicted RNase H-related nuclease YkuK (DUF458 family)
MYFSPTLGELTIDNLKKRVSSYMHGARDAKYRIIVGSDSQKTKEGSYDFVVALAIHRIGAGGVYFWKRDVVSQKMSLKERMYREAILSLTSAEDLSALFRENGISKYDVEIHVDIGPNGKTKELISDISGMVRASGYEVKIKPDSFGASKVADRHT